MREGWRTALAHPCRHLYSHRGRSFLSPPFLSLFTPAPLLPCLHPSCLCVCACVCACVSGTCLAGGGHLRGGVGAQRHVPQHRQQALRQTVSAALRPSHSLSPIPTWWTTPHTCHGPYHTLSHLSTPIDTNSSPIQSYPLVQELTHGWTHAHTHNCTAYKALSCTSSRFSVLISLTGTSISGAQQQGEGAGLPLCPSATSSLVFVRPRLYCLSSAAQITGPFFLPLPMSLPPPPSLLLSLPSAPPALFS